MADRWKNATQEDIRKWAVAAGSKKTRGYFGWLKEHDPEKFKEIAAKSLAARKAKNAQKAK